MNTRVYLQLNLQSTLLVIGSRLTICYYPIIDKVLKYVLTDLVVLLTNEGFYWLTLKELKHLKFLKTFYQGYEFKIFWLWTFILFKYLKDTADLFRSAFWLLSKWVYCQYFSIYIKRFNLSLSVALHFSIIW